MDDIEEAWLVTDKGLRAFIEAFEYALGYEPINTTKMKRHQLLKYFGSIRKKADLKNNPDRELLFGMFIEAKFLNDLTTRARNN
jgi:hypothetical protein